MRVLVVEDEREACELISEFLHLEGLEPHCVTNDRDAYAALKGQAPFSCMIVDVNLGTGTTGYDVARYARQIDPQLPVIYVSGQTSSRSIDAYGVPGALFVEKPFLGPQLVEQVRKLIGDNDD
jgi:DNA-binding response OmpR family regulator